MHKRRSAIAVWGYVACKGPEFFTDGYIKGRKRLQALTDRLGYNLQEVLHVEQQAYRQQVVKDIGELLSKARTHHAKHPEDFSLFCCDNIRIVRSLLPEYVVEEIHQFGGLIDSIELERMVTELENAELRAHIFS